MALTHAILALLIERPQSGYDLTKNFEGSVGNFWKASHQQIYRDLGKMEEQGWVTSEILSQEGKPDKKLYSITELGRSHLTQWIAEPCDMSPVKEELLVKVFVGELVDKEVLRQELERHRQLHHAKLTQYQRIQAEYYPDTQRLSLDAKLKYLVLRRGMQYETEWMTWCDEAIQLLADRAKDNSV